MSILKAFLVTILLVFFWTIIQLAILLPIKYLMGIPDDITHIFGITKILSVVGSFSVIYFFFWKPDFHLKRGFKINNYKPKIYWYLPLVAIGLLLLNKPFYDFTQILDYYQGSEINTNFIKPIINIGFIYDLISTLLVAPIIEELFFRKFLLGKLSQKYNPYISLLISGFCFSIIHIETPNN